MGAISQIVETLKNHAGRIRTLETRPTGTSVNKPFLFGGRITLSSGIPVTSSDVTAATALYVSPYSGSAITLYRSSNWATVEFAETSLSLVGYTASTPYDIFAYISSGILALDSCAWASATARATNIELLDGVYVKSGDPTRLYLGTIYINSSGGQTDDSATKRNVWNYFNRVERWLYTPDSTSHTYNTDAYRYWNDTDTNYVEFTCGVAEEMLHTYLHSYIGAIDSAGPRLGLNLDATMSFSALYANAHVKHRGTNKQDNGGSFASIAPLSIGRHTLDVYETNDGGSGTASFYSYYAQASLRG